MSPWRFETGAIPEAREVHQLFAQTDWAEERTLVQIETLLEATPVLVSVYDGEALIAFGRALSDGVARALIDDLVVTKAYQGRGIGTALMKVLLEQIGEVEEVFLNTGPHLDPFYQQFGFRAFEGLTMVRG